MPATRRRTQLHAQLGISPTASIRTVFDALVRIQALARRYIVRRLYTSLRFTVRMNQYLGRSSGANPGRGTRVRVGVDRPWNNYNFYEVRGRTGRDENTGDMHVRMFEPNPFIVAAEVDGALDWNPPESMARNRNYVAGPYPIRRRHNLNWWPYRV